MKRRLIPLGAVVVAIGMVVYMLVTPGKVQPTADAAFVDSPHLLGCTRSNDPAIRHAERDQPIVALTFDDGPSQQTPEVMKILRRQEVQATFFVVGREVSGDEWMLRRMIEDGNEIGNHTTTHTALANIEDIAETTAIIERVTGFKPCHFRPPEGVQDRRMISDANQLGMNSVRWDVDSKDFLYQTPESLRDGILGDVRPGSIILMHDGGGDRSTTIAALPGLIEGLRADGYEMVTLTELLGGEYQRGDLQVAVSGDR